MRAHDRPPLNAPLFIAIAHTLVVTYVPIDANLRGPAHPQSRTLTLARIAGQDRYEAQLPAPDEPPFNAILTNLYNPNQVLYLFERDKSPAVECGDPSAWLGPINPFAGLPGGGADMIKLYGSATPAFPLTVTACSNPNAPLPEKMTITAGFTFD